MTAQHILQLGQMVGLSCTELNANGDEQALPTTLIAQALADFGFADELDAKLEEEVKQFWLHALPPAIIADESTMIQFDLHLPIEFVTEDLIWEIRSNHVVIETGEFTPIEWSLNGIYHLHDMEMQSYQISLEQPLAVGAYQLVILDQGSEEPLGTTWVVNPPASLTAIIANEKSIATAALPATDMLLAQLFTQAKTCLPTLVETDLAIDAKIAQLQCYFNAEKEKGEFVQQLEKTVAAAELYQVNLAQYLTAYVSADTTCSYKEAQTVEWQDANRDSCEFYLWLFALTNQDQGTSSLRQVDFAYNPTHADSFAAWLLADYQLANSLVVLGESDTVAKKGINSYQLRQDNYAAFRALIDFTAVQSAGIVLTQPLSFMQEWLTLGDAGIWQNHEFNELLSIILLSCERHACACYYQADDELPTELTDYLQARGLNALSV
ncbi:hypothetical protein HWV00_15610 [Moritella sp. 24]|uniref:hypothetical protein n=1 Tax=Moritella sp. 24 TaxID=2746230 RepID=UPI001BA8B6BE|nr:hypothetical protein [Moritella sp. 24]QUM77524.1 hypothetical protein HWV00_15610 [Moritella sp. 24]